MKKRFWLFLFGLYMMLTPMVSMAAEQGTAEQQTYGAPAYGTSAVSPEREAAYNKVREKIAGVQELAEQAAPLTYAHNVSVDNYSDADTIGRIYESRGSGVIFAMDGNVVYIVTAAHCVRNVHTDVTFADGSRHTALVGYKNAGKDVAFLLVNYADLKPETLAVLLPAAGAEVSTIGKQKGDAMFAVSSADYPNALILPGVLDAYRVVYPNNPSQQVIQFYSEASYGSSGGGIYTQEGIWLGTVSGGDTFGKCWGVPYSDIMEEFQGWLTLLALQQNSAA